MKKFLSWAFAAALICSSTVFTSCVNEDNPVNPADNLAEKLIGKWMPVYLDGNPVVTDLKSVYTFVSATKAYMSLCDQSIHERLNQCTARRGNRVE